MNEQQYRKLLELGLGRAIVYARAHDVRSYRDVILDACLHCRALDPQTEGTRGSYMYDLVALLPDKADYHGAVIESLRESGNDWDTDQRFHFAACLAVDGDEHARQSMYRHYSPDLDELVAIEFVELDGIEGLLFVADRIGASMIADSLRIAASHLLSHSFESCGEEATWNALRNGARDNPRINAFLEAAEATVKEHRDARRSNEVAGLSYDQLLAEMPYKKTFQLVKWGDDEGLGRAATGLSSAASREERLLHLRIFARRPFPLDPAPILALAGSEDNDVARAAAVALENVECPAVRTFAHDLVNTRASLRDHAIAWLSANYRPGDHRMALNWFEAETDRQVLHSYGMDLIPFWDRHPDESTEIEMLRALYEKGPCSFCREGIVKRLIGRGALTAELREECAYDCNDDIRGLVA